MKVKDQDMAKRGANNTKQAQEGTVSRDHAQQTKAGAKEYLEKDKKQKDKKSDK